MPNKLTFTITDTNETVHQSSPALINSPIQLLYGHYSHDALSNNQDESQNPCKSVYTPCDKTQDAIFQQCVWYNPVLSDTLVVAFLSGEVHGVQHHKVLCVAYLQHGIIIVTIHQI